MKGVFIEFFGLAGELSTYDRAKKQKEKVAAQYKLKVIALYPKDLFPRNKLNQILGKYLLLPKQLSLGTIAASTHASKIS